MNSKQFLMLGGIVLLILGIVGFLEGDRKLLGDALWFDQYENYAHVLLGIVAIGASYTLGASAQRTLTGAVGVLALIAGVWGFVRPNFFGANFEILDNIVHLAVAVWAYLSMRGRPAMAGM